MYLGSTVNSATLLTFQFQSPWDWKEHYRTFRNENGLCHTDGICSWNFGKQLQTVSPHWSLTLRYGRTGEKLTDLWRTAGKCVICAQQDVMYEGLCSPHNGLDMYIMPRQGGGGGGGHGWGVYPEFKVFKKFLRRNAA